MTAAGGWSRVPAGPATRPQFGRTGDFGRVGQAVPLIRSPGAKIAGTGLTDAHR
jgi:hypothetical protein